MSILPLLLPYSKMTIKEALALILAWVVSEVSANAMLRILVPYTNVLVMLIGALVILGIQARVSRREYIPSTVGRGGRIFHC